ncbi:MAG: GntR family transcriptional regulator [Acidobacteriota bacterium]
MSNSKRDPAGPFQFQLNAASGVPIFRQIIDQVLVAIASGALKEGNQLPTVRQVAVDLSINPNTVMRAYRELEIRGILATQQGTGTFIAPAKVQPDEAERQRRLSTLVGEFLARAAGEGFRVQEVVERLNEVMSEQDKRR